MTGEQSQSVLVSGDLLLEHVGKDPLFDAAVLVRDGRIAAIGESADLQAKNPEVTQVGGKGFVVMPTFINSHDHGRAIGTESLGIADSMLETWLPQLWGLVSLDPYWAAVYDGLLLLRSGVGSTAHSHNPRSWSTQEEEVCATIQGYRDVGLRVAVHPVIIDQNSLIYYDQEHFVAGLSAAERDDANIFLQASYPDASEYFDMCQRLIVDYHDLTHHLCHVQLSPAGGCWCSDDLILKAVDIAQGSNTKVQMHLLETKYQRAYAQRTWKKSFVQHLDDIGALGSWLT